MIVQYYPSASFAHLFVMRATAAVMLAGARRTRPANIRSSLLPTSRTIVSSSLTGGPPNSTSSKAAPSETTQKPGPPPPPSGTHHGLPTASTPSTDAPPSSPTQQPISQLYRYTPNTTLPPSLSLSDITRPGGRQSVSGIVATVFGASGFLGRYAVNHLGRIGSQVVCPYRGDGMNVRHLRMSGDIGQIVQVPFTMYDEDSIVKSVNRSNVAINFIGSRYQTANYSYKDANVRIPHRIARIASENGVERFIHVSCFGASEHASSDYFRAKWEGEQAVKQFYPNATILRPTTVFGAEDKFLNWIATIGEKFAALPTVNDGKQRIAPIFVQDVARAVLSCVMYEDSIGKTFEIAGPDVYTFNNIVKLVNHSAFSDIRVLSMPDFVAKLYGRMLEGVNVPVLNRLRAPVIYNSDMVAQTYVDQVPDGKLPGLAALGVDATPLLSVLDQLMLPHRPEGLAPERFPDAEKIREAAKPIGREEVRRRQPDF